MIKKTFFMTVLLLALGVAAAAGLPNYYPKEGFQRVGTVDSVQLQRRVVVVNDVQHYVSDSLIVHSPNAYSVPATRLAPGMLIGYKKIGRGGLITQIWLLPSNYKAPQRGN